jgi:hypothetical protein
MKTPIIVFLVFLVTGITRVKATENVPPIAAIAGIRLGADTIGLLEQKIGKGHVTMGGHSRGGREWRFNRTGWYLYADGFYYNDAGGRVIDTVSIELDNSEDWLPNANLSARQLSFMGVVFPGMKRDQVLSLLRNRLPKPEIFDHALIWTGNGDVHFNRTNHYEVKSWKATLSFQRGILHRIFIEAHVE